MAELSLEQARRVAAYCRGDWAVPADTPRLLRAALTIYRQSGADGDFLNILQELVSAYQYLRQTPECPAEVDGSGTGNDGSCPMADRS